jgi:hypothetical protein
MTTSHGSASSEPTDPSGDEIRDDLTPDELRSLAGERAAQVIEGRPSQPREAAIKTVQRYGAPDAVMPSRLIWTAKRPWKRVVVNRDTVPHRFPKPHNDLLEEWVAYRVPPERLDDVARFDGSVIAERTKGELGARCDTEEMNYLALNLAHDVITRALDVDAARRTYTEKAAAFMMGTSDPYADGLHFPIPAGDSGDRDVHTITA